MAARADTSPTSAVEEQRGSSVTENSCPNGHWIERAGAKCNQCPPKVKARPPAPARESAEVDDSTRPGADAGEYRRELPLDLIDESPTNPRRRFDEVELNELADSIRPHGVVSPVLVRPHPTVPGRFELVFGARRFRGSKIAGRTTIPAIVRELTDLEVLELQIVENLQRKDVTALEEAAGYQQLRDVHKMNVDQIAAKIGKSRRHVYARLSLSKLTRMTLDAIAAAKCAISDSVALLLTALPEADQFNAAVELGQGVEDYDAATNDDGPPPLRSYTVTAAEHLIRTTYMRSLEEPPFDVDDAALVPGAPACGSCVFNSANQDGGKAGRCADRACFQRKVVAGGDARLAQARATGIKVLAQADSPFDGTYLATRKYVDAHAQIFEHGVGGKTGREVLAALPIDKAPDVVLARDSSGAVRELIPRGALMTAIETHGRAAGIVNPASTNIKKPLDYKTPADKKREQVVAQRRERAGTAIVQIGSLATKLLDPIDAHAIAARALARGLDAEDKTRLCKMLNLALDKDGSGSQHGPADKALAELFARAETADHWLQLVVLLSCAQHAVLGLWANGSYGTNLREVAEKLGVELEPVREPGRQAKDETDWRDAFSPPPPKKKPGKAKAKKPAASKKRGSSRSEAAHAR